ncbi:MAG: hypothetical protein FP824_07765 [Euryarchaeota archaeon]|nr:hypothetical protein [Euryarchaeota archaeon]
MIEIKIELSEEDLSTLNTLKSERGKSASIGKRAEEILKIYFRKEKPGCTFEKTRDGSDLKIIHNSVSFEIEIKGTEDKNIAWNKLKVSSQKSHDCLIEGLPIYRVTDVFSKRPILYILKYGIDFDLKKEPRWSIKSIKS